MSILNNDGLFEQILQAQETQREGWMPEIKEADTPTLDDHYVPDQKTLLADENTNLAIALNDALFERDGYARCVAEKDAEIARLKKELGGGETRC